MREAAPRYGNLTFEEYLAIEASSDVRHEFVAGTLYAMACASRRHARIAWNIAAALTPSARDYGCDVLISDMLVRVGESIAYYPDVSVVCDPDDANERYAERPCLIVEITSPSSEERDQREKLIGYRGIASLQTYLVVFQHESRVIHYQRTSTGSWTRLDLIGEGIIQLSCPPMELSLNDIYSRVTFDPSEPSTSEPQ
ncbi:MAG: Uma2 family endonuclease [Chloroflexi bacterium]|nr:MAG: Uma2 family endonuclease [Chloroflexota bacterium]